MEGDSLMLRGSWFHSLVMKSIGERCFSVTMLNLRCLICEALSLQISMNWLMASGSFLLMNFQPYMHAWVLKMSVIFMMCIFLNDSFAGSL